MKVTLITPTADQPMGIFLCERYMARQTAKFHQWIVADDGEIPATLTMGQQHLVRRREHDGGRSLAGNILAALPHVKGDVVVIIEHDDYYAANHLHVCIDRLKSAEATGSRWQRYYNIEHRSHRLMRNIGSALCNTSFRVSLLRQFEAAAHAAFRKGEIGLDRLFWDSIEGDVHDINTVVGIKGLPGRRGLGLGHRPGNGWTADPDMKVLQEWIGSDVENYR